MLLFKYHEYEGDILKRTIVEELIKWKNKDGRKPLILTGVRQCGKTYVCEEFGKNYFKDYVYLNFEINSKIASIFEYDFDVQRIIDEIAMFTGHAITVGETLLIFDEIQACPQAITSLKYFCENLRELHVICAGSLLGVAIKRDNFSFPVGKVDRLEMFPMSFYEFVQADGGEALLNGVAKYSLDKALPEIYAASFEKYMRYYYIVGGMPEAVLAWTKTHNFEVIEEILENIVRDYRDDFSKHAPMSELAKLYWIWDSVPKQLAKENNKFVFSHVKAGKRSAELEDALEWLRDAGLILRLELVANPEIPLSFVSDATYFKVYMSDIGILRKVSGIAPRTILEETDLYKNFKGALTENFVYTELIKQKISPFFWRSQNTAELDFVFEYENEIVPVEAKAENHTRAKSYSQFCKKYYPKIGIKTSMKNSGIHEVEKTHTQSLPLYMLWKIKDVLKAFFG